MQGIAIVRIMFVKIPVDIVISAWVSGLAWGSGLNVSFAIEFLSCLPQTTNPFYGVVEDMEVYLLNTYRAHSRILCMLEAIVATIILHRRLDTHMKRVLAVPFAIVASVRYKSLFKQNYKQKFVCGMKISKCPVFPSIPSVFQYTHRSKSCYIATPLETQK